MESITSAMIYFGGLLFGVASYRSLPIYAKRAELEANVFEKPVPNDKKYILPNYGYIDGYVDIMAPNNEEVIHKFNYDSNNYTMHPNIKYDPSLFKNRSKFTINSHQELVKFIKGRYGYNLDASNHNHYIIIDTEFYPGKKCIYGSNINNCNTNSYKNFVIESVGADVISLINFIHPNPHKSLFFASGGLIIMGSLIKYLSF